ncbi:MAG TPA: hypothetical protein VK508_11210 [Cyclobacteriaceae bacterium]|nr:hypothetical protein [Cyclobacteriaceae bacterium]
MKFLNIIDLGFQTFILGAVVLSSIGIAFVGHFEAIGMIALYGAIFLGPWQMVSSVVTTIARGVYFKLRVIHLVSSIAYIAGFSIAAGFGPSAPPDIVATIAVVLGFSIPLALAILYYYITLKSFQLARMKPA